MERIYIAGCGGMLGEAFYIKFREEFELKCTDIDVNEEWISYLDFRDLEKYRKDVRDFNPHYLFHLGALTDLEYCELHPDETFETNTRSVEHAVSIANELDIPLLYVSTAGIYDGHKEIYDDWDLPNPQGVYSRSKFAGEQFVRGHSRRYLVCRAGWMMGGGPTKDKKFINKLIRQLKIGRRELNVVNDKLGTPTYTHDFAGNVRALLERNYWGLYNMVCDGAASRLEIARELVAVLGWGDKVKINEVSSDFFRKEYFAPRPDSERLINCKLRIRGVDRMRDWKIALRDYVGAYYANYI